MPPETLVEQLPRTEAQPASAQDVHLLDLLIVLARRRRPILGVTIGSAILAAVVVVLIPSRYTAETVILPPGQNSSMSSAVLGQLGGSGALASMAGASLGIKNPGDLYVSLLKSETVEDAMIRRFDLMARYRVKRLSDARKKFEARTSIALGPKDGLITLSITDHDPQRAADMANGYIDEYRKFSANLAITEAAQRRIFFQQQLLEANENLAAAEEAMKKTEQATGAFQIDSQTRALVESAASLRAQIVAKQVQLQGMRAYATEDNPAMLDTKQQLAALEDQLAKLSGSDQGASSGLLIPKGKVPEAELEYIRKLRDVKYYETVSDLLARQFEIAKVDEARQGSSLQVVDVALTPDHRSFPKRTITVILSALFGVFAACGWCIVAEGWRRMQNNPAEAERLAALRDALR